MLKLLRSYVREDVNDAEKSISMPWYDGLTVLEMLDDFEKESLPVEKPFRMPVQDVYKFSQFGDNRRIVAGTALTGAINVGDEVVFFPSGKKSRINRNIECS